MISGPLSYDRDEPMYPQTLSWSCSACALAWLNRALGIDHATDESSAIEYIGSPEHINATYGLMDGSGGRLVQCLREQGAPAFNGWLSWLDTYDLATRWPLLIGGVNWNHWVGVRYGDSGTLKLANSAPGWGGVDQVLEEEDWHIFGPFAVVPVPLLTNFPGVS
jgi:hypothetical protein